MSSEIVIKADQLGKCYHIYNKPRDRLLQMISRGKRKYFEEFWALRDVSFEVKRGETVGLIGRNGCGKSTLLQMVCGTLSATTGTIITQGRVSALLELGSGFNPEFTGRENVYLNCAIHGLSVTDVDAIYDGIAGFADIGEFINHPVKTYSSGMYARLAFASAIFVKPDIFIVDEILAVGDAPFQTKCMKAFHDMRDNGTAILLVSHDSYMVRKFCQRAIYLKKGRFVKFGDSSTVISLYNNEVETAISDTDSISNENLESKISSTTEVVDTNSAYGSTFQISKVSLMDEFGTCIDRVKTGQSIKIMFSYTAPATSPKLITFVVNLYRHDGLYVFGSTTLMDSLNPVAPGSLGTVTISFPELRLLSGQYIWRVAINDDRAFGVYAEANQVCPFHIEDELQAVGLFNLERHWSHVSDTQGDLSWND